MHVLTCQLDCTITDAPKGKEIRREKNNQSRRNEWQDEFFVFVHRSSVVADTCILCRLCGSWGRSDPLCIPHELLYHRHCERLRSPESFVLPRSPETFQGSGLMPSFKPRGDLVDFTAYVCTRDWSSVLTPASRYDQTRYRWPVYAGVA